LKKILVTGAAGLLGQALVNQLQTNSSVLALDIAPDPFEKSDNIKYLQADLIHFEDIKSDIERYNPDISFNAAGMTDVDLCETERDIAYILNVGLLEHLLQISTGMIVQYSTDYVFDGKNGPYAETDPVNPIGYYGETKLISEQVLQDSGRKFLIVRTNVLFGTGLNVRPNFISWLITNLLQEKELRIADDMYSNPTHGTNLAEASIEAAFSDLSGIFHIAGSSYISRYETAVKTAKLLNLNDSLITPVKFAELNLAADRPLRGGLKIEKASSALKTRLLSFEDALKLDS